MPIITGLKQHLKQLDSITGPSMVNALGRALVAVGSEMATDAQTSITNGAKSGRIYTEEFRTINGRAVPVGKRTSAHQASAPGEAPADDTGGLASHIEWERVEPLKVIVSSNAKYAQHLEFGTSKMAERPYMRPAAARARKSLPEVVRNVLEQEVKKHG